MLNITILEAQVYKVRGLQLFNQVHRTSDKELHAYEMIVKF